MDPDLQLDHVGFRKVNGADVKGRRNRLTCLSRICDSGSADVQLSDGCGPVVSLQPQSQICPRI